MTCMRICSPQGTLLRPTINPLSALKGADMGARSSLQKRTQREPLKPSCPEESTGTGPSRSAPAGRPPPWNASLIDCRPLSAVMPQPNALGSPMISMEAYVRSRRSNTFLWSRSQSGPDRSLVPVAAWSRSQRGSNPGRLSALPGCRRALHTPSTRQQKPGSPRPLAKQAREPGRRRSTARAIEL